MFKQYVQNPICHIPIKIEKDSEVALVNRIIDWLEMTKLLKKYKNHWQNAYNPKGMMKILFYGYMNWIRSSEVLGQLCKKHVDYMFLIWNNAPSAKTIRTFRKTSLIDIKDIFIEILQICIEIWMTQVWDINIDWSKFKANASSRQTKTIERIDKELNRLEEFKKEINKIIEEAETEDERETNTVIKRAFNNKKISKNPEELDIKKILWKVNNREEKLKEAKKKMNKKRLNKMNITDNDAKFMKTSEWKIKPAYNTQISSNNQVVQDYEVTDRASDNGEDLQNMIKWTEKNTNSKVKYLNADAWYNTEDNLEYCKDRKIDARIPDSKYYKMNKWDLNKFDRETFGYDEEKDEYICPNKKRLSFKRNEAKKWKKIKRYEANKNDCQNCPLKNECIKWKVVKYRSIAVNNKWEKIKWDMRKKLNKEKESNKYQERMSDVEPVFGNIKQNKWFRGFSLMWKIWAKIEMWLMMTSHNLTKICKYYETVVNNYDNKIIIWWIGKELCLFSG
jgi:transposase